MAWKTPIDEDAQTIVEALAPLRNGISVAVTSLGNAFAAGAIIRVSHSFLVREIIFLGDAPLYEKASMGMEKYERVVRVADTEAFYAHAAGRPVWVLEREHASANLYAIEHIPDDVIFVFGSERFGVPEDLLARADRCIALPMYGVNNSFPVAISAGMVLAEWGRRRYAPGRFG